jgi:cobalamin biosynthesis protein CbiD
MSFSIYAIPNVGDPVFRSGYTSAVNATSSARAEARLMLKREAVSSVEIVTIENSEAIEAHMITRSNQHDS